MADDWVVVTDGEIRHVTGTQRKAAWMILERGERLGRPVSEWARQVAGARRVTPDELARLRVEVAAERESANIA